MKSWSLDLLELFGPVQTCAGIALPLPFTEKWRRKHLKHVIQWNIFNEDK
jgi:hypothetical protein